MPKAVKKSSSEWSVPSSEVSENTDTQAESSNWDQEPEPRSYGVETPEGVTNRRTQNHLKPYKSYQKTQRKEQSNQKQLNMNQTSVKDNDNLKQLHPKRQIKIPIKLNLSLLKPDITNVQS